jgi:hypothetical protein
MIVSFLPTMKGYMEIPKTSLWAMVRYDNRATTQKKGEILNPMSSLQGGVGGRLCCGT